VGSSAETEKILILCRAIPEESKKYFQTVCVAGVNDKWQLRRLYPVSFKPFVAGGGIPFHKKEWVSVNVSPSDDKRDKRVESRKIDISSVRVLKKADDNEVRSMVKPFLSVNIGSIEASESLGFIRPKIIDYELKIISTEVTDEQTLITEEGDIGPRNMTKLKQESIYRFVCQDRSGCTCLNQPHRMEIHDWEVNELYRNVVTRDKDPGIIAAKMRQKWFDWMKNERDVYFMLGTHFLYKTWMIVSVLYLRPK
jgi:hypothetical protein